MNETGVRINVPPLSVLKDEITIAGEKEGVMTAKERIQAIHQEMVIHDIYVDTHIYKSGFKH